MRFTGAGYAIIDGTGGRGCFVVVNVVEKEGGEVARILFLECEHGEGTVN